MKQENKITINNLIYALLFLLFGILLLTKWDLMTIASQIIGYVLIGIGIIKIIVYVYMKGKVGDYKLSELIYGLLLIFGGFLLITYSGALSFAIRTIAGLWVLFSGINRIILAISIKQVDSIGFKVYFTTSILMIIIGLCLMSGLVDRIIGLFIIGYSVTEIVNYVYYRTKNKSFVSKEKTKKNSRRKRLKETKVVDAIIEEEKN